MRFHRRATSLIAALLVTMAASASLYAQSPSFGDNLGLGKVPYKSRPIFSKAKSLPRADNLPRKFDLRKEKRLTPVRNQGQIGSCWTFATMASLESNLFPYISAADDDFSEKNLMNLHGFASGPDDGGNATMSIGYLARWSGPVPEALDPYPKDLASNVVNKLPQSSVKYRVTSIDIFPDKDYDAIKRAVMQNGAIYSTLDMGSGKYFNDANNAYYCPNADSSNHAISIVGWDDDFPKSNFNPISGSLPKENGAFIVRNSWGDDWGDKGYFYVSYEDAMIGTENVQFRGEPDLRYNRVYQLDSHGAVTYLGDDSKKAAYAVVYTAAADEDIQAAGLFSGTESENFEIYFEAGIATVKEPTSKPVAVGNIKYPGYHVINFENAISVKKGQKFAVYVKISSKDSVNAPCEMEVEGYVPDVTIVKDSSYLYSQSSKSWDEFGIETGMNIALKVFATSRSSPSTILPVSVRFSTNSVNMIVGETKTIEASVSPENASDRSVNYLVKDEDLALLSVGKDGNITAKAPGVVELIVTTKDKKLSDSCRITITAKPADPATVVSFKDPELENAVRKAIGQPEGALSPRSLAKLTTLRISSKTLDSLVGIEKLPALSELYISDCKAIDLSPLAACPKLSSLSLEGTRISDLKQIGLLSGLKTLALRDNPLVTLNGIETLTGLTRIELENDRVKSIAPLSSLKALSFASFRNNRIQDVEALRKLTRLKSLDLSQNSIKDIAALAALSGLETLYVASNPITDFEPTEAYYDNLKEKDFDLGDSAKVSFADPLLNKAVRDALGAGEKDPVTRADLKELRSLFIDAPAKGASVSLKGIEQLVNLTDLSASGLGIVDIAPVGRLARLQSLDLSANAIKNLSPLSSLKELVYLDLSRNAVEDISPLASLVGLEELFLGENKIADIKPLSFLTNLTSLDIKKNSVSDLGALKNMKSVKKLDVSGNKVKSVAVLKSLPKLNSLFVRGNQINDTKELADKYRSFGSTDFDVKGNFFDPAAVNGAGAYYVDDYYDEEEYDEEDYSDYEDYDVEADYWSEDDWDYDEEDAEYYEDEWDDEGDFVDDEDYESDDEGDYSDDEEFESDDEDSSDDEEFESDDDSGDSDDEDFDSEDDEDSSDDEGYDE